MTWYRKTVIRILLLVASMVEQDADTRLQINQLAAHISVWSPEKAS